MAPPGCLPRRHLRGSVHRRGRARRPPPPPPPSFSGPEVSLSSPALRPRGPWRLGPPRQRGEHGPANREPHAPPAERPRRRRSEARTVAAAPPGGGSRTRARREAPPGTPGGPTFGAPLPRQGPLGPERGFLPGGKAPLFFLSSPRCGKGRGRSRLLPAPKAFPQTPVPRLTNHRPPDARRPDGRPSPGRRRGKGRGAGAPPGGAVPSTPPSRHAGGSGAPQKESRARENSGPRPARTPARTWAPATGVRRRRPRR